MNVKEHLNQYRIARARVERCKERLRQIQESIDSHSTEYSGEPKGTKISDPTAVNAIRLAEMERKLRETLQSAEVLRQQIADEIEQVDGVIYQELLYSRYVLGLNWSEVAWRVSALRGSHVPYDEKHVRGYMHAESLRRFEASMKKNQ